ncbi:MAG: alkaline phosphatase D family protein [Microthrixaceae bacterium]|nr:alkaline phosphatase D family protein [Microthrixaceae bacterium]
MDRRQLLLSSLVAGVTVACASDNSDNSGDGGKDGSKESTTTQGPVELAAPKPADLADSAFLLGVASGDPESDRVMLWTRVFPADASTTDSIEVAVDVARDESFTDLIVSQITKAGADLAHSVHVDVTGLDPDTWYYYRFRAGDQTSVVARTRTFPKADAKVEAFNFVFASCQDFQWGYYGAWASAAQTKDLDAIVFLGDYIYEMTLGDLSPDQSGARVWGDSGALTLSDYRGRYTQAKADPNLQAAHHAVPWIITFDDHEVSDNYAGDVGGSDLEEPKSRDRRLAAYQAWYEHTPIRLKTPPEGTSPEDFDDLTVNRGFSFGDLANMFVIETRQHADPPSCRTTAGYSADEGPLCDDAANPDRSNLGTDQEKWLFGELEATKALWNILANPVMLADMNIGSAAEPKYYRDMWIGYPAARERLLAKVTESKVSNPVVVTGDWHASFVLDVQSDPHGDSPKTVLPEFLVSSISSVLFPQDYQENNPQIRYFKAAHGYALVRVTREQMVCEFSYIDDVWDPDARVTSVDRFSLAAGDLTPKFEGSVTL